MTTNTPRWRRITTTAIASAIAIGATVLSAPAANAIVTWEIKCPDNPAAFHPDALSGVFRFSQDGNDRFEFCDVYSVAGIPPHHKPGGPGFLTTYSQYFANFYTTKPSGVPPRVSQPPLSPQG